MTWIDGVDDRIHPLDIAAMAATQMRLDSLTKPRGSLGRLEALAVQLSGITGDALPHIEPPVVLVFAADHGVSAKGVSAYPSAVTAQMVANFLRGGAAINVLARLAGARMVIADVGVAEPMPPVVPDSMADGVRLITARIRAGTADFVARPAMNHAETMAAIEVGRSVVADEIVAGCRNVALGEMGIGNTTSASAITAVLTGRPPRDVTGQGTGLDEAGIERKTRIVEAALERHGALGGDPIGVLGSLGGLEIAALVGAILAAAEGQVPIVLDGFITGAAALVAAAIAPRCAPRLIASHRSSEPGHRTVLEALGLRPLLELDLRLGEASGAALALPILAASTALLREMATFGEAGVSAE